jgi:hypothetical protein
MPSIRITVVSLMAALAPLGLGACSSAKSGTTHTTSPPAAPVSQSTAPSSSGAPSTASATSSTPSAGSLSGHWSGSYSGAYTGTFTLSWTQTGSQLSGTIDLSTSGTTPLNGSVRGSHITFGTVGSTVITYSGSVSGNSMSGSWQIAGGAGGSGSWSAHRM